MTDARFEKILGIWTKGLVDWPEGNVHYNRCEPTPYDALEHLFKHYHLKKGDKLVDFGSGKGRVAFYVHNRFKIPVVGIEAQREVITVAWQNHKSYQLAEKDSAAPIHFEHSFAEDYRIQPDENRFYFFNPFSVDVFNEVLFNIETSLKETPRKVHIILYYPLATYKSIMRQHPLFKLHKLIKLPHTDDHREKFIIYRSTLK